jgi:hypothetical protein
VLTAVVLAVDGAEDSFNIEDEDAFWADPKPSSNKDTGKGKGNVWAHSQGQDQGGKSKCGNASEPAHALEQTTKRLKTRHADEKLAEQSLAGQIRAKSISKDERRKSRIEEKMAEFSKAVEMPKLPDAIAERIEGEDTKAEADDSKTHNERLERIMGSLDMHPDNQDTSTRVVNLPEQGEDRVLTAVTNPSTKNHVLHDTRIPHSRGQTQILPARRAEQPFLKDGKHGRGGDFENDPDRRTGRGHEVVPEDQILLEEYLSFRGRVLEKYPRYPGVDAGQEVDPNVKQAWDSMEMWHNKFTNKYAGFVFNHLWPCGCEKVRGESEAGESEEE